MEKLSLAGSEMLLIRNPCALLGGLNKSDASMSLLSDVCTSPSSGPSVVPSRSPQRSDHTERLNIQMDNGQAIQKSRILTCSLQQAAQHTNPFSMITA